MNNPFDKYMGKTYAGYIYSQIRLLKVNSTAMIDTSDKTVTEFRTSLAYVSNKYNLSFRTKTDDKGNVWVVRVI